MKTKEALSRSDRVLVAALAIVLATASAAVGASLNARPHTEQVRVIKIVKPVVKVVQAPAIPAPIAARGEATNVVLAPLGGAQMPRRGDVLRGPRRGRGRPEGGRRGRVPPHEHGQF